MGVLTTSWRGWFAATALWALLGTGPNPATAQDKPAEKPPAGPNASQGEREKMYQHLQDVRKKLEQFEKEGKREDAEAMRREARQIMAKLSPQRSPEAKGPGMSPERERMYRRLQEIRQKVEQLEKEGKHEDAQHLKREADEMVAKFRAHEGGPHGSPAMTEKMARLQHLRVAAENLKAAGMEQEARHVMELAERVQREMPEGPAPMHGEPGNPQRALEEMHGQMQQMHREMQELREQVKHLIERSEHK
jgi:hypothetical protein